MVRVVLVRICSVRILLGVAVAGLCSGCTLTLKPYTAGQFARYGIASVAMAAAHQEPVNKPIDLYEAMARAVKYNLNYQVEVMQTRLRAELTSYLLPRSSGLHGP